MKGATCAWDCVTQPTGAPGPFATGPTGGTGTNSYLFGGRLSSTLNPQWLRPQAPWDATVSTVQDEGPPLFVSSKPGNEIGVVMASNALHYVSVSLVIQNAQQEVQAGLTVNVWLYAGAATRDGATSGISSRPSGYQCRALGPPSTLTTNAPAPRGQTWTFVKDGCCSGVIEAEERLMVLVRATLSSGLALQGAMFMLGVTIETIPV